MCFERPAPPTPPCLASRLTGGQGRPDPDLPGAQSSRAETADHGVSDSLLEINGTAPNRRKEVRSPVTPTVEDKSPGRRPRGHPW